MRFREFEEDSVTEFSGYRPDFQGSASQVVSVV